MGGGGVRLRFLLRLAMPPAYRMLGKAKQEENTPSLLSVYHGTGDLSTLLNSSYANTADVLCFLI